MDTIKTALFESPTYIYLFLGLAELALAAVWYQRKSRGWVLAMTTPILLAIGVFALEAAVVTDREYISTALDEMAAQLQNPGTPAQRLKAVADALDDSVSVDLPSGYGTVNMTRKQALAAGERVLADERLKSIRLAKLAVELDSESAKTRFTTIIYYETGQLGVQPAGVIWVLHWLKQDTGWRIVRVEEPIQGVEL